ncbi:MAG: hypothetical protein V4555_03300, partial [Acidobacteriota bacterium]
MLIVAPALLLCDEHDGSPRRVALEWSALTVATLAVSPIPASYNFTLLILPVTVLVAMLLAKQSQMVWLLVALYVGIGCPSGWHVGSASGWGVLLQVPRLYMLIAFAAIAYAVMGLVALHSEGRRRITLAVAGVLAGVVVLQAVAGVRHQRGLAEDFAYRVPDSSGAYLVAAPEWSNGDIARIAMEPVGYRLLKEMKAPPQNVPFSESSTGADEIAFAAGGGRVLVEEAGGHSVIRSRSGAGLA